jgi:hypothetical protein
MKCKEVKIKGVKMQNENFNILINIKYHRQKITKYLNWCDAFCGVQNS